MFLAGYRGRFLQCDAYQSYNALAEIPRENGPWQLVHCWTHVRRRFVKRFENEGSPIAEEMLRRIAALYGIEKTVRGRDPAVRLAARREHAAPIIAALKPWLEAQLSRIPQKSRLAEDIRYTLAHWPGLIRFLEDGTLELDTNPVENQIRPIALTRKNALFAGNETGAENWAMLASLVATCKLAGVNPVDYLADTLRAILDGHPKSRIEDLMPWRYAHPLMFLAGYRGRFLQCDAYQSYNALAEIPRENGPWQLVHCWTHVRRRFVKRFENEGSPIAEEMLRRIAALYGIEKTVRGRDPAVRLAARREHAAPIIAALKPWLEAQLSRIPQKSRLAEDIRYTLAHWPGLIRFLEDGRSRSALGSREARCRAAPRDPSSLGGELRGLRGTQG